MTERTQAAMSPIATARLPRPTPTGVVGVDAIRACFPALERRHNGEPVAYFDGPGGTQVPRDVVDAMSAYLYHHNANTHWQYPTSIETDQDIDAAREALADFVNGAPDEIAFGLNMTTLTFHLARALGRGWGPGDEVVVTELDHHGNVAPWTALAKERGITIRTVRLIRETGTLDLDELERSITTRTRLVAIGAASNALGTITDVAAVARRARAVGAYTFVDAVHYAPHVLVDARGLDCDFIACSAYKFYGPHIGILYGKRERLGRIDVPKLVPAPDTVPERLETGTQNHEGIVGAAAAVNFLAALGNGRTRRERLATAYAELHRRSHAIFTNLWMRLSQIRGVKLYGPPPDSPRTSTISFTVAGIPADDVARRLAERALFLSSGDFYATTVIERLGQAEHGVVRAGCACYTTESEAERLADAVERIAAGKA
jgi:cysteine desulfurase family protein (TIGR01976 family)